MRCFLSDFLKEADAAVLQQRVGGTVGWIGVAGAVETDHDAVKRHLARHCAADQRLEVRLMRPGVQLLIADAVVVVDLAAHVVVRLHFAVIGRVAARGGAVVHTGQRAFAADQHFLADLLGHAEDVNLAQERVAFLRGGFQLLLHRRIDSEFCCDGGRRYAV